MGVKEGLLHQLRPIFLWLYRMQGTGLPRIGESLRKMVARYSLKTGCFREIWVDDLCGRGAFCCDLSEHMGGQIFFRGCYSEGQLPLLAELLPQDCVFVDVGANHGEFSICAASVARDGNVYAYEPMKDNIRKLRKNIDRNGFKNIFVQEYGLSNIDSRDVPIYTREEEFSDGSFHGGLGTIYSISGRDKAIETINLHKLDDVFRKDSRIDVIKIDVEGAELTVLQGACKTIERTKPYIIFEANSETSQAAGYAIEDLLSWFRDRGYRLVRIGSRGEQLPLDDSLWFSNLLAIPYGK